MGSEMCFFFQAEDGIRDLVRSRGLGDVYKGQELERFNGLCFGPDNRGSGWRRRRKIAVSAC